MANNRKRKGAGRGKGSKAAKRRMKQFNERVNLPPFGDSVTLAGAMAMLARRCGK